MTSFERAAYLRGLADGLGLDKENRIDKFISGLIDAVEEISEEIAALEENDIEMGEEIDAISDDLADVEAVIFDEDEEEPMFFEVACPKCGNEITIDENVLAAGSIDCPNCGEKLEFIFDEDDDEDEDEDEDED